MWPVQRRWSLSSKTRPPPAALSSSNNNPSKDGGGRSAHRPKHHHNHPSSSSASAAVTEERRKIELIDLDFPITGRHNVKISIKENSPLSHVTDGLKKKYSTDGKATTSHHHHHHHHSKSHRIPEDATVELYQVDRLLTCSDEIPRRTSSLFYRVLPAGDDASALRITWRCPTLKLRRTQLETLAREAGAAGTSIGSLRESAAALLRAANPGKADLVQSAQQVVVEAAGGLRPGALQGNAWEARKVRTWLCRHLTLDLRPVGDFVVLRGVNEEYVWHRPYRNPRGYVDVPMLRQWLKNEVLAQVHARGIRRRGIDADDIRLSCRGKTVRKHSHVRPGETLDFEVPRAVEDGFVRAEAWLLPLSETCVACGDDKRVSEMPARRRVTAACEHDSGMCRECVGQWIRASLDTATWDRLRCPECPQLLSYEHVRAFAPRDVFDRYDALAVKAVLGGMEDFAWCLNPACESGQIYPPGCARAKCSACKHYLCVRHKVPWHSGETCEEYDRRTRRQRRNDQASEKHVKEITKPCPGCNRNINKYVGCDHVTCICGHEWCWLCFGDYYRDQQDFLQCHHTLECRYHDNPPNYEGGRAFMPFLNIGGGNNNNNNGGGGGNGNIVFPFRPRERAAAGADNNNRPAAPGPVEGGDGAALFQRFLQRRNMHRNPFDPNVRVHLAREREREIDLDLDPDFFEEAMLFNMGHLMHRAERDG